MPSLKYKVFCFVLTCAGPQTDAGTQDKAACGAGGSAAPRRGGTQWGGGGGCLAHRRVLPPPLSLAAEFHVCA